jgi:hypothetical protein
MSAFAVGIIASDDYPHTSRIQQWITRLALKYPTVRIAANGGKGANQVIAEEAAAAGLRVVTYAPDWDGHGKAAAYRRNEALVASVRHLVIFGAAGDAYIDHPLKTALAAGKVVFYYDENDSLIIIDPVDDARTLGEQGGPPAATARTEASRQEPPKAKRTCTRRAG